MLRIVEILCEMNDEERRGEKGRGGEGKEKDMAMMVLGADC